MSTDPSAGRAILYRGDVKAIAGIGDALAFVTVHAEGQPTALYRLDPAKPALDVAPLPRGGLALTVAGESLWIAGGDGQLFQAPAKGGPPKPSGSPLASPPTALAPLADNRLAALAGAEVAILAGKDAKVLQKLELPEAGSCLAADPTGRWLAVGTVKGTVAIFEAEGKPEFQPSEAAKLHEGAVTSLLFEPEELRFLSAGADLKLLTTHARGKLEPEDRGKANNHTDLVTALIWGPGDRLYTGSRDGTIKNWPRTGGARPATLKDGVGRVVALALVEVHGRAQLVAASDDNSLRFFTLDAAGKFGEAGRRFDDAYSWARSELAIGDDSRRREEALKVLAGFADAPAIERISEQVGQDGDHGVRQTAAQLLADSTHPRAAKLLEKWLNHPDAPVRVATFHGLRRHLGETDLRPLDLALKVEKLDVGRLAVGALESLARKDDQALTRLTQSLNARTPEVRQAALTSLENLNDPRSPEADLLGLTSQHADVRRLALVRLYHRRLLEEPSVQAALRRRAEDSDPEVRRTAFLLSLFTREKLVSALRERDPDLQRQLVELAVAAEGPEAEKKEEKKLKGRGAKAGAAPVDLEDADYEPLLQATASRALDTCLRGARGLALLGDPRAFGLLLQLSREEDAKARVEVCRALAALDDPRSINRLRSLLYDPAAEVRDAAFTALAAIHQTDPLLGAESGLNAAFEDVRRRGLQVLIGAIRKKPPKGPDEPSWPLLVRALNDSFEAIRSEAFKAALNLQLAGGGPETLRFVLQSIHADIRREVLTEVMAQVGQPWVWDLLLEFFNDPDPKLRQDAFDFAVKKTKTKGLEFLEAGLSSRYADVRKASVEALIKKHTAAAQTLLVKALADEERAVRLAALESLIGADAEPALIQALGNPHADVRLRAAKALARHGSAAALRPLLDLATAPEPREAERQKDWADLVESALDGLGELGDPAALTPIIPLLDSPQAAIRKQAARALIGVSRPDSTAALRQALQHADPQVKSHAALGLAYAGDASVASLVFSDEAAKTLSIGERLAAALTLGPAGEDQLVVFLDHDKEEVRQRALLLLLMLELKDPDGTAARCLAGLSSRMPRVRLTAASALERISDPASFLQYLTELMNDRGEKTAWKIAPETVADLAELLVHAEPQLRARTARLLRHLDPNVEEQAAWDQGWSIHAARFAAEVAALKEQATRRKPVPLTASPEQLRELAFGAYVGLVREQGGTLSNRQRASLGPQVARVRQTALNRILALARSQPHHDRAARPVLVQALGDPNQPVRTQAFEHLQTLGMDPTALAAEALASGQTDLGVKGLELLTAGASAAEGQKVLEEAMLTRPDSLATEAAKLLLARRGVVPVAGRALEAAFEPLRQQAVAWLAAEYEKETTARNLLHRALGSRYQKVREAAALELATRKDPAAFDALVKLLADAQEPARQRGVIGALVTLGDPRTPPALLDRLVTDPTGTALADDLLRAAGGFRRPDDVDRLLTLMERERKWRDAASAAVLVISGYDQPIADPDEEGPDRVSDPEEKTFPRHDEVLARLMERAFALGDVRLLLKLLPGARWARGNAVDPILAQLINHSDETLRRGAVEALGWRLRKRAGEVEPLRKALSQRDPVTQFIAAEGLARGGRPDGLSVLLASVEFVSDLDLRRRAVEALGELGDERALDLLLKLAAEDGHALQEEAAEALGHLGRSAKSAEIFKVLERHAKGSGGVAVNALKGLRWLNTRAGWQLIRRRAIDDAFSSREEAVELLGYDDDPASRDLLLRLLAEENEWDIILAALASARRLWGKEALEPDYAHLQNPLAVEDDDYIDDDVAESLKRVSERGEARRIFEILPRCSEGIRAPLVTSLLNRPTLPVAEAQAALASPDPRTVALAARVLGRAGSVPTGKAGQEIESALLKGRDAWDDQRRKLDREGRANAATLKDVTDALRALAWAAGRLGVAVESLAELATARADDPLFRPVRLEAVTALTLLDQLPTAAVTALETAALGEDAEARALAAETLGRRQPERAEALATPLLADRVSFNRLVRQPGVEAGNALRKAAGQVHYQGVALPFLVIGGDLGPLASVAADGSQPDATRLGAVEALAALATEPAEERLRQIGQDEANDDDLRKAAWRGLRRSKRVRLGKVKSRALVIAGREVKS